MISSVRPLLISIVSKNTKGLKMYIRNSLRTKIKSGFISLKKCMDLRNPVYGSDYGSELLQEKKNQNQHLFMFRLYGLSK